jgi:hypothetical protein
VQVRNALGCQFVAMVLGFLSTLVLGQGVLGTVVAVGTLLIFVLPAVMTVVIETTALRELSGQMADKLQEAADEEAQVTESPARFEAWARRGWEQEQLPDQERGFGGARGVLGAGAAGRAAAGARGRRGCRRGDQRRGRGRFVRRAAGAAPPRQEAAGARHAARCGRRRRWRGARGRRR